MYKYWLHGRSKVHSYCTNLLNVNSKCITHTLHTCYRDGHVPTVIRIIMSVSKAGMNHVGRKANAL